MPIKRDGVVYRSNLNHVEEGALPFIGAWEPLGENFEIGALESAFK